jgi:hypothetical protein
MGALIILHGLFLLHCNAGTVVKGSLQPQTCEILTADTPGHLYRVGANKLVELPFSLNLTVTLEPSSNKDPDTSGLDSRMMVLDSSVVKVVNVMPHLATLKIIVPMPDNIYGANVLRVFREDLLHGTDSTALRSQAGSDNRIALAESIVLSYNSGQAFSLQDGGIAVPGAGSAPVGKNQVLAFFAWPAMQGMSCTQTMNHAPLNQLLQVNGQPPSFLLMGLGATGSLDDPDVSAFKLPASILRPPCVKGPMVRAKDGTFHPYTATQTGCGLEIVIEN